MKHKNLQKQEDLSDRDGQCADQVRYVSTDGSHFTSTRTSIYTDVRKLFLGLSYMLTFYLLGLSNSPLCRWCEAGEETSAHVLCECEALAHADMRTWVPSFWSQGILRILTWGPSGATARLQGSHDSIWGTKGLSYLRPRCIGTERPRTHMQSMYLSIYLSID